MEKAHDEMAFHMMKLPTYKVLDKVPLTLSMQTRKGKWTNVSDLSEVNISIIEDLIVLGQLWLVCYHRQWIIQVNAQNLDKRQS